MDQNGCSLLLTWWRDLPKISSWTPNFLLHYNTGNYYIVFTHYFCVARHFTYIYKLLFFVHFSVLVFLWANNYNNFLFYYLRAFCRLKTVLWILLNEPYWHFVEKQNLKVEIYKIDLKPAKVCLWFKEFNNSLKKVYHAHKNDYLALMDHFSQMKQSKQPWET